MSIVRTENSKAPAQDAAPTVPWYRFDVSLGVSRGEAVIATTSTIGGAIIGWAVSAAFAAPEKIELWAVAATSIVATLMCVAIGSFLTAFQKEGRSRLDVLTDSLNAVQRSVTQSIDRHAVLIPREEIYREMACCVREAEEQVVVITYFMYDWEKDRRTFEPAVKGGVPGVDEFYEAIYECIKRPEVEYLRLWQVPAKRIPEARTKIMQDPRLKKEIELIEEICPDHPESCRVRIIAEATTASLILVDKKTLFFNIDLYDKDRDTWMSPFMLMVRDARGRAFADLRRVVVKLSSS